MGTIAGIIHGAGVADLNNPVFIKKATEDIDAVLLPKIKGLDYLINTIKGQALEFFIVFSSVSSIIPVLGVGQGDYALANDYMNYCVEYYKKQLPMIAIMWPSWKEIGMGEVTSKAYLESGLISITNKQGIAMLDEVLGSKNEEITTVLPAIVEEDRFDIRQLMFKERMKEEDMKIAETVNNTVVASPSLKDTLSNILVDVFEKELRCNIDDLNKNFQSYGVDSIFIAELITRIEGRIKGIKLDALAFLEYPSISQLADYMLDEYANEIKQNLGGDSEVNNTVEESNNTTEENNNTIEEILVAIFKEELSLDTDTIDSNLSFQEFGVDSIFMVDIIKHIEKSIQGVKIDATDLIEFNTIGKLTEYISENITPVKTIESVKEVQKQDRIENVKEEVR
nr:phosphopantetheine-binding protein [Cellulosilyticum ruminicola]